MVSRITRAVLGDSLFALRFFRALAGAAKVFLGGWIAREIGGGKFAQFLAAVTVLLAPIYLAFDNFLSMNAFEPSSGWAALRSCFASSTEETAVYGFWAAP